MEMDTLQNFEFILVRCTFELTLYGGRDRLLSTYSPSDSMNASFQFYYHISGFSVGRFRVYVKPLTAHFTDYNLNS